MEAQNDRTEVAELARQDLGVDEIAGPKASPRIMEYYRAANENWAKDDSVPWCGAACAALVTRVEVQP